ncbi:MAG: hypothetical protein KEFWMYNX_002355, partial [Candidatus Fervidibacter sp.]
MTMGRNGWITLLSLVALVPLLTAAPAFKVKRAG